MQKFVPATLALWRVAAAVKTGSNFSFSRAIVSQYNGDMHGIKFFFDPPLQQVVQRTWIQKFSPQVL